MQKMIGMLAALLVAQLLMAVGMSHTGPNLGAVRPDSPLVSLDDQAVNRLFIEGPDKQQIVLARHGDGWVLPGTGDFPADKTRVEQLLKRLQGLKRGLAVATTSGAQKRFKVSDEIFERRVQLTRDEAALATLYFGTSPGMRRVHVRTSEDDAVYTTEFGIHDATVKPEDWEDKDILKILRTEIESIGLDELTLARLPERPAGEAVEDTGRNMPEKTTWTSAGLAAGEVINQGNADALAQKLADMRIGAVLGREGQPEYGLETPVLVFNVQRKAGEAIEYRLGKRDKENDYVLKVSSRPEYFRLPGFTAEALIKAARRDELVTVAAAEADAVPGPDDPTALEMTDEPDQTPVEEGAS